MTNEIQAYNDSQTGEDKAICNLLKQELDQHLGETESKLWHGSPVWFLDGNPVVGYSKLKNGIQLLFWSGQSFNEAHLKPIGKHRAAEIRYTNANAVNPEDLKRWLTLSKEIQWDYKNIVRHKGELARLK